MTRNEIQKKAVDLALENDTIILEWSTGLGKTKASLDIMNALCDNSPDKRLNVLIVVAETSHKQNWEKEFSKFGIATCNICIECYASLKKYAKSTWDLVILDEVHHIGSDIRIDVLDSMKIDKLIGLSATIQADTLMQLAALRKPKGYTRFTLHKVSMKEAIEWGILPEPKICLIPLTLDNTSYNCTIIEERGKKEKQKKYTCKYYERWSYLKNKNQYPNLKLEISCTQQQKYDYLTDKFNYWKSTYLRTRQERTKVKWLQVGSQRKRFLGDCKTSHVKSLLPYLVNKRYICFCSSIDQAEILGNTNAIHSKNKDSQAYITKFNNKEINTLFAVNMAQEGLNLVDIDLGIIIQLDGYERGWIQKMGRVFRAKDPLQFIYYYKDTKDTDYLNKVIEGMDKNYIQELTDLTILSV